MRVGDLDLRALPYALAAALWLSPGLPAQATEAGAAPPAAWWPQTTVGLRVSFGLFALADGRWRGVEVAGPREELRESARIAAADYADLVARFRARSFDAREWARLAKDAGAGYVVFPAKAPDGFCLFRSAHCDFGVVHSPHERDMLRDFARACREEGLRLGVAYSIADLQHDDYLPRRAFDPRPGSEADFTRYAGYVHRQLGELLDAYAPDLLQLYGAESSWTAAEAQEVTRALRARPTPVLLLDDASHGHPALAGADAHMARRSDESAGPLVQAYDLEADRPIDGAIAALCQAASRGGHLLLDVRADGEGSFSAGAVGRLAALGRWVRRNREAVADVRALPWPDLADAVCTWRPRGDDSTLYVHVLAIPPTRELTIPAVALDPVAARVLGGDPVPVTRRDAELVLQLPANTPAVPVVAVDLRGLLRPR